MSNRSLFKPTHGAGRQAFRSRLLRSLLLLGAVYSWSGLTCMVMAGPQDLACTQDSFFYERQGYVVKKISIETPLSEHVPLDFIFRLRERLQARFEAVKQTLPLKEGEPFINANYDRALAVLNSEFGVLNPGERLKLVVPVHFLRNCDASANPPTLEAVYRVYTTEYFYYLSQIFEARPDKVSRSLAPGPISNENGKLLPKPYLGYNRSRGVFGGANASFRSTGKVLNSLDLSASGSDSSATAELSVAGIRNFETGAISHAEWRFGYRYSNIPSDTVRLKEGTLLAQFFSATRPLGDQGVIFRFGSSIEGGNRQAEFTDASTSPANLQSAGHGAVKIYLGATASPGRQAWKASYGLQLGQAGDELQLDYTKHIFDADYKVRFLPREHLPFELAARFSAGFIRSSDDRIPVAERFFGGNAQKEFIQGDDWRINSGPFIRSFPQNRLNRTESAMPIGGKNFFSANLTIAQTLWNRPLVPSDISQDTSVRLALGGQLATARASAALSYLTETKEYRELLAKLDDLDAALNGVQKALDSIKTQNPPAPIPDTISNVEDDISDASDSITGIKDSPEIGSIRFLVVGFPSVPSQIGGVTSEVGDLLTALTEPNFASQRQALDESNKNLEAVRATMEADYDKVNALTAIDPNQLKPAQAKLSDLSDALTAIKQQLQQIPQRSSQAISGLMDSINDYVQSAEGAIGRATNEDPEIAQRNLILLAEGFGSVAPAMITGITTGIKDLQKPLADAGLGETGQKLNAEAEKLTRIQSEMRRLLRMVSESPIQMKANRDVAFTGRVLGVIFRELNLVAFSPVVMFDVARIGPQTSGNGGVRYGVGAGGRFTLVTLEITMGYSWNPDRRPGEGRGAFVFSMDISDLFN